MGLLLDGDETVPYRLTPRGKKIWELRRECLNGSPVMTAISTGQEISRTLIESAVPHFSLAKLASSGREARLLRKAFIEPWGTVGQPGHDRVAKAYRCQWNPDVGCEDARKDVRQCEWAACAQLPKLPRRWSEDEDRVRLGGV